MRHLHLGFVALLACNGGDDDPVDSDTDPVGPAVTVTIQAPADGAEVLAGNARGLAIVQDQGEPTALGARLIDEMAALHHHLVAAAPDLPPMDPDTLPPG